MKKIYFLSLFGIVFNINAQNNYPANGDVEVNNANLTIETASWRPSLLSLKDTHYTPNQVYHFQIESDGLKIKQDGNVNYQFKSGGNFIVTTGKIGVGTRNPSSRLDVRGGIKTSYDDSRSLAIFNSGDGNSYMNFAGGSTSSRIGFQINGGSKMSIVNNGSVGIGTSSPSAKLEVRGSIKTSYDSSRNLSIFNSGDGNSYMNFTGGSTSSRIGFQVDGSSKMSIYNNGSIGIGTSNTGSHKLAVDGSIRAREIKVEVGTWSDFVFYKDYKLPTLQEVETHIKEKGHLQDIPSEKDVEENGINLGEMNAKLLQKIEELMLYTIQQQKEIDTLKTELILLKK